MRTLVGVTLAALLAGCGAEVLTTTAIVGELHKENASAMKGQLDAASQQMGRTEVQGAINTYMAEKGYYPTSLKDLTPEYLAELPVQPDGTLFNYNPETGRLLDGPGAQPPARQVITSGERYKMKTIREAINAYGYDTGYYPPNLQALVPNYLSSIPTTDDGMAFLYNPQDGALTHPYKSQQNLTPQQNTNAPAQRRGMSGAGGPMNEAVTSIGIQNQLQNMNQSGAAGTRSTGRRSIDSINQQHQRRQEKALEQIYK